MGKLARWLEHPLTRGLDIDDPRTTQLRRRIVAEKRFLRRVYEDWYRSLAAALPSGAGAVLELGSGAGFLADFVPRLVRSEVFLCPGLDVVLSGLELPFAAGSLRGILMTNVLHHLPRPLAFLAEAARCVRPGGVVAMVEPWVTPWSRLIYTRLHHEPFLPEEESWEIASGGPLSAANGALPWILFQRDRQRFERAAPAWRVRSIAPIMPFRYLVSGGVSRRSLMPAASYPLWRAFEGLLSPWAGQLAMFAHVVLERRPA
jgi:SAM-dependent methyltransferase